MLLQKKKIKKKKQINEKPTNQLVFEDNLKKILQKIDGAANKTDRAKQDINIVAVTKSFPPEAWNQAQDNHLKIIGENKVQEAENKNKLFKNRNKLELHLIGHLQSNKVKKAIQLFDVIQSVDSFKIAKKINTICHENKKQQKVFLQINIGEDPNKKGFSPDKIIQEAQNINELNNISIKGIMTIPPKNYNKKELHCAYKQTRIIKETIKETINKNCNYLSMGMSNDFEIAIIEGATHIRLGTAIFGPRKK